jgi:glyoxylate reductase
MPRVAVSRRLPFPALERLEAAHDVITWEEDRPIPRDELVRLCDGADGLLCMLTDAVDDALLSAAPSLRAVAVYAVGTDNVDRAAARAHGVAVGNTPDVLTEATADIAFALLLAAARRLPEAQRDVREGRWRTWTPDGWLGLELHGATLGIIGNGRIGQAVARRAAGFGMEVLTARPLEVDEVLERSDVVSLHVPLTETTRGLIDANALARMKPGAILVNTARGPIVDQRALADALRSGHLAAAGLDVTDPEPLPPDDPLLDAPNLVVLPHIGSATHTARARMADLAVDNLLAALDGRPMPHPVAL